jgi:RNA polymerase sigma-70 factor (ECF subfamily)
LDDVSDEDLIRRFLCGDEAAFDALFRRYEQAVYTWCFALAADAEQARDLFQESFLHMYKGLPGFEGRATFRTWARKVTFRTSLQALARERRQARIPDGEYVPARSLACRPDEALQHAEESGTLAAAIRTVPADYRAVLILRDVEGLAYEDIGNTLGLSLAQVKSRLHRARRMAARKYRILSQGQHRDASPHRGNAVGVRGR